MVAPRTVVVVNPNSQGGRLGKRWPELGEAIARVFPFEAAITAARGDATRLTREALRAGAERVIAVGGDGTVNEVVNGFFADGAAIAPDATFGLIPFGTGGDFRRTLRLSNDVTAAASVIASNHRKKIDVGKVTFMETPGDASARQAVRMFANVASFGSSGVISRMVEQSGKRLGRLSFLTATLRATWSYKNQRIQLVFDGKDRVEATLNTVAIANARYFGGGMKIAPNAEIDDGSFDVVAIGDLGFTKVLTSSPRLYTGSHINMREVSSRRARVVSAEPIDPGSVVDLEIDGEAPGRLPATFEVVPSALWAIVPAV
ncbi:MAG: diacylglycerol kinase family protein [Kofleriaceae bacterium]